MWTYQFERSYNLVGFEPILGVCVPRPTPAHPFGDPALPYFQYVHLFIYTRLSIYAPPYRCHSGDLYYTFGTLGQLSLPFRDEHDLPFEQLTVDAWTAFARTFNPNPDKAFLVARGYAGTAAALEEWGLWGDVESQTPVRVLAWPSRGSGWLEQEQCDAMGFPLDFYEH
jgi:hypothetical protein